MYHPRFSGIRKLIPQKGNALPNTLTFTQKIGFLRYCNPLGFQSICALIDNDFSPVKVEYDEISLQCVFVFGEPNEKVHLMLRDVSGSTKKYIFGSAYIDNDDFHETVIAIVKFVSKHIGCSFYLDDATRYPNTNTL